VTGNAIPGAEPAANAPPLPPEALVRAARRFGTPVHVTSVGALESAASELREAFPDPWLRAFSLKANDVPALVARLADLGLDANVVSSGEWAAARAAGLPNARITLEGIGKSAADLRAAVRAAAAGVPLRWVAVESAEELDALVALADRAGLGGTGARPPLEVLLRLNPDVSPETHAGLAVGRGSSKFGMTETELTAAVSGLAGRAAGGPVAARGIHLHVGSQLGAVDAWRDAVRRGLAVLALLRAGFPDFDTLDVGGGFPVGDPGTVPTPARFAAELPGLFDAIPDDRHPARLAVEPGRFLVASAGCLVASVLHVRERADADRVVVIDAGMTELIRPALYGAVHPVTALTSLGRPTGGVARVGAASGASAAIAWASMAMPAPGPSRARVDGPICESTDTFGTHDLPPLRRGDLVAIGETGAYAASMSSTYNGRPAAAQVLLETDGLLVLGRRRGRALR
jgi:diaminopimelate decarboxylase